MARLHRLAEILTETKILYPTCQDVLDYLSKQDMTFPENENMEDIVYKATLTMGKSVYNGFQLHLTMSTKVGIANHDYQCYNMILPLTKKEYKKRKSVMKKLVHFQKSKNKHLKSHLIQGALGYKRQVEFNRSRKKSARSVLKQKEE